MVRIHLSIHESDLVPVARAVSKVDEFRPLQPEEKEHGRWHRLAETLGDQDDRFAEVSRELGISSEKGSSAGSADPKADVREAGRLLDEIDRKLDRWRKTRRELTGERDRIQEFADAHPYLAAAGLSFTMVRKTRYLDLRFGWIPADQQGRTAFPALRHPLVLIPLGVVSTRILILGATLRRNGYVLERVLKSLFCDLLQIREDMSEETLNNPKKRLQDLDSRMLRNDRDRDLFADEWRSRIITMRDRIREDLQAVRLIDTCLEYTGDEFWSLSGELPGEKRDPFFRTIQKTADRPHGIFAGRPLKAAES